MTIEATHVRLVVLIPEALQWVHGTFLFYTYPYYLWREEQAATPPDIFPWDWIGLFDWLRSASAIAFGLYVWITAPTFGLTPECNRLTTTYFFFRWMRADRGAGNIAAISVWSLNAAVVVFRTIWTLRNIRTHLALRGLALEARTARRRDIEDRVLTVLWRFAETIKPSLYAPVLAVVSRSP
jgi:hypothetical protein